MKQKPKNKVAMSATAIAARLAEVGHPISRQQVSKDIAKGADDSSAEAYLASKQALEQRAPRKLNGNQKLASLREQKITEEIAVLKVRRALDEKKLAEAEGRLVETETVHDEHRRIVAKVRAVLTQKFETELPPKLDGSPAVAIADANRKALDEVFAIFNSASYA